MAVGVGVGDGVGVGVGVGVGFAGNALKIPEVARMRGSMVPEAEYGDRSAVDVMMV